MARRSGKARRAGLRPLALSGAAGLCALSLTTAPVALAQGQQQAPAGPRLVFDARLGVTASDNPDFEVNPPDSAVWATGALSFGFADDNALSSFSLTGNLGFRKGLGGNTDGDGRISDRALRMRYDRNGANAQFSFSAVLTESRLEYLRPLTDFVDSNGVFTPPDDLDQLNGTGWRRRVGFDTKLTLGSSAPFGATLGAGVSDVSYRDTSSASLDDNRRSYADVDLRFNLSQVTQATVGVRFDRYEDSDQQDDEWTLRLGLAFDRPDGQLRFGVQARDTASGTRTQFQVGRQFLRGWGSLDTGLGVIRDTGGKTRVSGDLSLVYNLPNGALKAALARSVGSGTNNAETMRTTASIGYSTPLSPQSSLTVDLAYVQLDALATDLTTRDTSFGISYSYALTQDWNLNLGYDRRRRDEDLVGVSDENTITLSISHRFTSGF